MSHKVVSIIINIVGIVAATLLLSGNSTGVILNIAGATFQSPVGTALIALYIVGVVVGIISILPFIAGTRKTDAEKLKDWQKQDTKLLKEVQSDKEKQLEAKIATLEVALKQALKK